MVYSNYSLPHGQHQDGWRLMGEWLVAVHYVDLLMDHIMWRGLTTMWSILIIFYLCYKFSTKQIYFSFTFRFLEAYKNNGITFWGLTVQNEPVTGADLSYKWQTMYFSPKTERYVCIFLCFYYLIIKTEWTKRLT